MDFSSAHAARTASTVSGWFFISDAHPDVSALWQVVVMASAYTTMQETEMRPSALVGALSPLFTAAEPIRFGQHKEGYVRGGVANPKNAD